VDLNNPAPVSPYTNWLTAATNIQDAVDVAVAGDLIWVTNGVYRTGGRVLTGGLTNRVALTAAVTLQSVNGPGVTVIEGCQVPDTINGDAAVRCACLPDGAALIGFTLTNGATRGLGSDYPEMSGGGAWCQSTNAVLSNCVLVANSCQWWGGGAYSGTQVNCELNANTNKNDCLGGGGGAAYSHILNSTLSENWTGVGGLGGALSCYLSNCVVTRSYTAGATDCMLDDCVVIANKGTGVSGGAAINCTISSNMSASAGFYGGGASSAALTNCLIYANSATKGGGVYKCVLSHCTLSNNWAHLGGGIYVDGGGFPAWTTPFITDCTLTGNVATDSGGAVYVLAVPANLTLARCIFSGNTATNNGGGMAYATIASGKIIGCTFTDNRAGANGGGVSFPAPVPSGTISNCSFFGNQAVNQGGATYNANLSQCSLAGNQAAYGGGAGAGSLAGCTLSTNWASIAGGGAWGADLQFSVVGYNRAGDGGGVCSGSSMACTFIGNSATANGGGACSSTLRNCLLVTNAANTGGGAYGGSLYNCTLANNTATNSGGGISTGSTVANSIIYYNTAPTASNYASSPLTACCAMPLPSGSGNISNAPAFVDFASGNLRLQTNSPCINSGNNSYAVAVDLDGRRRIVGAKVDMGAYEYQGAGMGEFIAWLQHYGLPANGSADYVDTDSDLMNNWQEWIAGTNPTNAASVLRLEPPDAVAENVTLNWLSVANRSYFVERASDLTSSPAFSLLQANLPGLPGTTSFTDTNPPTSGPVFYRVGVQP